MLVYLIEIMPYVTAVFVLLTIVAAVLIPLFYTKKVRIKGKKRILRLSKFKKQLIVGIFSYVMGIFAIACTPVLIPYVDKITDGNQQYPLIVTAIVAVLMLIYVIIEYLILTIVSNLIVKKISSGR